MRQHCLRPGEGAEHVDLKNLACRVQIRRRQRPVHRVNAGVVDQDVQPAKMMFCCGQNLRAVVRVIRAPGYGKGRATQCG